MVGHPVRPVVVRRLEDECTQILAQPSHISLPTGVPVRIDRDCEGSTGERSILSPRNEKQHYGSGRAMYTKT
jgi:hypothetical protein